MTGVPDVVSNELFVQGQCSGGLSNAGTAANEKDMGAHSPNCSI